MTAAALTLALLTLTVLGLPAPTTPQPGPAYLSDAVAPGLSPAAPAAVWPLDPRPTVVAGFDPPLSAYGAGHRGVDLAGRPGQPVRAAAAGRVVFAGAVAGRGVVVVDHGATRTTYEPVRAEVALGSLVTAGEQVGTLQSGGSHCAPATCLHWGLIAGETYLDPLTLLSGRRVRLLPLFSAGSGLMRGGGPAGRPGAAGPW